MGFALAAIFDLRPTAKPGGTAFERHNPPDYFPTVSRKRVSFPVTPDRVAGRRHRNSPGGFRSTPPGAQFSPLVR